MQLARVIGEVVSSMKDANLVGTKLLVLPFYPAEPPTDASIIGIVDHWDVE